MASTACVHTACTRFHAIFSFFLIFKKCAPREIRTPTLKDCKCFSNGFYLNAKVSGVICWGLYLFYVWGLTWANFRFTDCTEHQLILATSITTSQQKCNVGSASSARTSLRCSNSISSHTRMLLDTFSHHRTYICAKKYYLSVYYIYIINLLKILKKNVKYAHKCFWCVRKK